jgi:uncharacterized membrane protein YhaH (DUF805 family)
MGDFFGAIPRGFRLLARFRGRDRPGQFWPYLGATLILDFVAMSLLIVPAMFDSFARMQRFVAEHPDQAMVESGPGSYSVTIQGNHPELMPNMAGLASGFGLIAAATVLLLAAAVARRLHDRGLSALLGLMPLPFLAFAALIMPRLFASVATGSPPDMRLFLALFLNSLLYLASLLLLAILLAQGGTKGSNRFGPDPRAGPG